MRHFATYIEFLLMTRHYVYVPGIGAFMQREAEGRQTENGWTAPVRKIQFNRFTTHDDGALTSLIMEAEGITYDEAYARVQFETSALLSLLERNQRAPLGQMGNLIKIEKQAIAFENAVSRVGDPMIFGLDMIEMRTWAEIEKTHKTAEHSETISISKTWLKRAAACTLFIIGLFSLSTSRMNESRYEYASMLDRDMILASLPHNKQEMQIEEEKAFSPAAEASPIVNDSAIAALPSTENINLSNLGILDKKNVWREQNLNNLLEELAQAMKASPAETLYFSIVASCTSQQEAEHIARNYERMGLGRMHVLPVGERYRVYSEYFNNMEEANAYVRELRESNPKFARSWVNRISAKSLSNIIKNTNNDNQLFMELSHPNRTTERDQG